jgi:aldehyde:ferredoxin oxidoreductase
VATAGVDATGMCLFIAFAVLDQPETFQALIDMINAFYGLSLTADDVANLGKNILKIERDFNHKAGFTSKDDRLPAYMYREKIAPHNVTFQVRDKELDQVFNW